MPLRAVRRSQGEKKKILFVAKREMWNHFFPPLKFSNKLALSTGINKRKWSHNFYIIQCLNTGLFVCFHPQTDTFEAKKKKTTPRGIRSVVRFNAISFQCLQGQGADQQPLASIWIFCISCPTWICISQWGNQKFLIRKCVANLILLLIFIIKC